MRTFFTRASKGFTLIELLVVIAIIGILASVVLISLSSAKVKSRDGARVAALAEMAKAISLADTGAPLAFVGCDTATGSGSGQVANITSCTGPSPISFAGYTDPSVGGSGTLCNNASGSACQYSMATSSPTTEHYEICTYLETGAGTLTKGLVQISNYNPSPVQGCN